MSGNNDDNPTGPSVDPPVGPPADPLLKGLETAENEILKDNLLSIVSRLNIAIPIPEDIKAQEEAAESSEIVNFIQGDVAAFEKLFKLYYPQVVYTLVNSEPIMRLLRIL